MVRDAVDAYAVGLWCADSYWWSSSAGISNVEPDLVVRFSGYLSRDYPRERLRLRVYEVPGNPPDERVTALTDRISIRPASKMKRTAYHLYVNSRPLVRRLFALRTRLEEIPDRLLPAYLAGRFDGDGNLGATPRIAYTTEEEARTDQRLLARIGVEHTSVLHYARASEYCIYLHVSSVDLFKERVGPHSWKVSRSSCRDCNGAVPGRENPNLRTAQHAGPGH